MGRFLLAPRAPFFLETRMARTARKIKSMEPMEHPIGQDHPRDMPIEGPAKLDEAVIEPVPGPGWRSQAEEVAFLNEMVTVIVHETTDKNPEPVVMTSVNGRNQFFVRGEQQLVRRMYVEQLVRAKTTTFTQERFQDAAGNDSIRNVPRTTLRYPFSVVEDNNPRGGAWLRTILAQG